MVETLGLEYRTCEDAYQDLLHWMAIVYGDLYGNKGINTSMYYMWSFIFFKLPQWITLCSKYVIGAEGII